MNNEIKKIENDFMKYKKEVYPHFINHVLQGQAAFEPVFEALYQLYLISAFMLDTKFKNKNFEQKQILNFYIRGSIYLHGIYHLCNNGIITNATLSLRAMFEDLIYLKTILEKDTHSRFELYTEYDKVDKWLTFKNSQKHNQSVEDSSKIEMAKIKSDYDEVKDNYHPKRPYHWYWKIFDADSKKGKSQCNLSYLCKRLNWIEQYHTVYSATSLVTHGSNLSKSLYKSKNSITLAPIFNKNLLPIISLGAFYFSEIARETFNYFEIDKNYQNYVLSVTRSIQKECKK